jgi:hypothetical protein
MTKKYNSGREFLVGRGIPLSVLDLNALAYEGAVAYGVDGNMYYSNGFSGQWVLVNSLKNILVLGGRPVVFVQAELSLPDIDFAVLPKGTGALLAAIPDNAATGGNQRGANATDFQLRRIAGTQVASGALSAISGGENNTASGLLSLVAGGSNNTASGSRSAVGGGSNNTASGPNSTIGGGTTNTIDGSNGARGTIAGGNNNTVSSYRGTVGGGAYNTASGVAESTVGGGAYNTASGLQSAVLGGQLNVASGDYTAIVGGTQNQASGEYSIIGGGYQNQASGYSSIIGGGSGNQASGAYSVIPGGISGTTRGLLGRQSFASGAFGAVGDAQYGLHVLRRQTANATLAGLGSDGNAPGTSNIPILPNNSLYTFRIRISCIQTGGTAGAAGNCKAWDVVGAIKRGANAAATALLGTPTITVLGADTNLGSTNATGAIIAIAADTTLGGLVVNVTGEANKNLRWVATIETTEVSY